MIKKYVVCFNRVPTQLKDNFKMPGMRCAVFGCNNSLIETKKKGLKVIYHRFPQGNNLTSSTIRNEWIRRCKRADKMNPNTSVICSTHFTQQDYERDLQNELLGFKPSLSAENNRKHNALFKVCHRRKS